MTVQGQKGKGKRAFEKMDLLRGVDLFSGLSDAEIRILAETMTEKIYGRDEVIIVEDDAKDQSFFVIAEGRVKVGLAGEDGREALLALLSAGDFFGEMSLLTGEPRSATVRAVEKSRLLTLRREDFLQALSRHPGLSASLLAEMSRRLRKSNRQVTSLALMRVCGRVAATLLELMEERGQRVRSQDGRLVVTIKNRPTQQQIADLSGTTRETVSRVLTDLEKRGCIAVNGRELVILQEDGLKAAG